MSVNQTKLEIVDDDKIDENNIALHFALNWMSFKSLFQNKNKVYYYNFSMNPPIKKSLRYARYACR